jgi:hypothetical protein
MSTALETMEHDGTLRRIMHRYDDYGMPQRR